MKLKKIEGDFSVCKVEDITKVNFNEEFCFYAKTDDEISLVCKTQNVPDNITSREDNWRAFRIEGVLDFSLIGILAKISEILAENSIGIFVVSTYNTDYIMVKNKNFERALEVLREKDYEIM